MSKAEHVEEILHCALQLFARNGYGATSLREIANEAGVGLGTINFLFQTKENLFLEVVERVINEINAERLAMLQEAREREFTLEQVIRAILLPVAERVSSSDPIERGKPYLVRWSLQGPSTVDGHGRKLQDEIAIAFVDAFLELMPGLERVDAVWGYALLTSAAYSRQLLDQRYDHLLEVAHCQTRAPDAAECVQRITGVIANGLYALSARRGS